MIYSSEGLAVSYDKVGSTASPGGYDSSGSFIGGYSDKDGNYVNFENGNEISYGNSVYNDGTTVYVSNVSAVSVDLSTGLYGTAVNIDATPSTTNHNLAGNWAANIILSGIGGSFMWGGSDYANDILVGNTGYDRFVCGKNEGSDTILNADMFDTVLLYDVNLSDIVATASDGYTVGILFNTGNVLTVTGTSTDSAGFALADGSTYRYNYSTKTWTQTA